MKKSLNIWLFTFLAFFVNEISFAQYVAPSDSTINSGVITSNTYLGFGSVTRYLLSGIVKVDAGATLTIKKGTIIFGAPNGVGTAGGTLVIRRGGKLIADGTVDQPIVFTSSKPIGQRAAGDWGGVILLGKATNNLGTDVAIEGLTGEFHGGTDDADNSGILRYVRIEFAGFELSPNNEINGLTMGSVGSGTIIEHIQVSYSLDDSYEWFGGTVNPKYLICYRGKDDDLDTDNGFRGHVQFALVYRDPQIADQSKSEAFESDNDASGDYNIPRTAPVFSNVTVIGPKRSISDVSGTNFDANFYYGVHQRRATKQNIFNSVIMGFDEGGIILDGDRVMTSMQGDSSKFRYNFIDGTPRGGTNGTVPNGFVFNTWFDAYNTNYPSTLNQVNLKAPFNANAPGLNPLAGSPLIGAANFSDPMLAGFQVVSTVGAFQQDGNLNWDRGWANYDPQNTAYGLDVASDITDFTSTVYLTNSNNETRQVVLGRNSIATDGLDDNLGEYDLPPLPPTSVIDLRLELPGGSLTTVLDLRPTGTVTSPIVYKINFQPGTVNGKLSWDPNLLGPGSWTMKVGSLVSINMKTTNKADIATDLLGVSSVTVEVDPRFAFTNTIASNWNLVSVPGLRPDMSPSSVYTTKDPSANVYKYSSNGYQTVSTLVPGQGYWLKSSTNSAINLANTEAVVRLPFKANASWNIIGSYEYLADVNFIRTSPENKKTGQVFKYVPGSGYQAVTVLEDGFGYWINLTGAADIIIPGPFSATLSKSEESLISKSWGKIIITDAAGQNYTLYASDKSADLNMFNLPPLPPEGSFDVRFESQRYVEDLSSGNQMIKLSGVVYPVTISAEGLTLKLEDAIDGSFVSTVVKEGSSYKLSNSNINTLKIGSEEVIPNEFSLDQNYPNPFNPSTTIKFSLPEAGNVRLIIYNALGQKITELVNSNLDAGSHSFTWNASGVASGLYFYELNTNNFSSVKKMMLMK